MNSVRQGPSKRAAPSAFPAQDVVLVPGSSVGQAFSTITSNCLDQVRANAAGVSAGQDPEPVHQMRVGLRRLNSALRLFKRVAPCPAALRDELKWLARELGAARDWEVLAGATLPNIATTCPNEPCMVALQDLAQQAARRKRRRASAAVQSVRYARLLIKLKKWLRRAPEPKAAVPLKRFAGKVLRQTHKKLQQGAHRLADPAQRHRMRIASKKMRYATEFFASLYPQRKVRRFVKILARLQDTMGGLNDATVAHGLLRQLARNKSDAAEHAGFARGVLAGQTHAQLVQLEKQWLSFGRTRLPCGN